MILVNKMDFNKKLNEYIDLLDISGKELSKFSNIKEPIISYYRNGTRIPKYNSNNFNNLVKALILISNNKNINLNEDTIRNTFKNCLKYDEIDFNIFKDNFNKIINTLKINSSNLSKYIGFDSSFISKIKSGIRKPSNLDEFINKLSKFIITNYNNDSLKQLINNEINQNNLYNWLINNNDIKTIDYIYNFNIFDYLNMIYNSTPIIPKLNSKSKIYYNLNGYKESQLDILKYLSTLINQDIFIYNKMPLITEINFIHEYIMYLSYIVNNNKINIFCNLNIDELTIYLKYLIPLYMSENINLYYFKDNYDLIYNNIEYVSKSIILHGSCIKNKLNTAKILLSTKNIDINYYNNNFKYLLDNTDKLIDNYKEDINLISGNRKNILHNLPLYTISNELLDEILENNNISNDNINKIKKIVDNERIKIKDILTNNKILDEIYILKENEFNNILDLSNYYKDLDIKYSYQEYLKHIKLLKEFKKNNKNYNYKLINNYIYKNINIYIIDNKQLIISKVNNQFKCVIKNPILIKAIEKIIS